MRKSLYLLIAGLTLFAYGCSKGEEQATEPSGTMPSGDMNAMKKDDFGADDATKTASAGGFDSVKASFGTFCMPCHSAANKKDDVDLESIKSADDIKAHKDNLIQVVEGKKMPPPNAAKQPTDEERAALVTALKGL